ncbi:NDP-hexose 2,3-dehydratase family protein [Candidatus Hydrogenedentota bacterium]
MNVRAINTGDIGDIRDEALKLHRDLEGVLHSSGESDNIDFFISSLTEHNPFNTTEEIAQWLREMNGVEYFHVETIPLADLRQWSFNQWSGDLCHESGKFFSIRGLEAQTNVGPVKKWSQPIIDQPEIGVLGILAKKIDGILYLLMQAKPEPGNINTFQLSPTVQATQSNYKRVHGGKPTRHLEYFLDETRARTLIDQLQSEQGARFYRKRNRNIIVRVSNDEDIDLGQNFRWVTLGQLKRLMLLDNTVNMDTRSVVSNIDYNSETRTSLEPVRKDELRDCLGASSLVSKPVSELTVNMMVSAHSNSVPLHTTSNLLRRLSREKFRCELKTRLIPLNEVRDWQRTPHELHHAEGKFFSIIGVRVAAANREVSAWDQPIVKQMDRGIVGFIAREINDVVHFLVQLKMESGNLDLLELAPTVQCITGSYEGDKVPPFVPNMIKPTCGEVMFDTMQSEEGGRFYHEDNRNMLLMVDDSFPVEIDNPRYLWMSMNQLNRFLGFNNFLNVESRSLLAII